jgi:predicted enzyme related to lactoylglutathione lyase
LATRRSSGESDSFTEGWERHGWRRPPNFVPFGAAGALVKMAGCPSGGSTLVYFSCEDCSVEAARAAVHGGEIVKGKMSIGEYGFIVMVVDTEGNMIGLHSMQ